MKQCALILRALNFNVGLQKYIAVYLVSLQGIAAVLSAFKEESTRDGVLVLNREAKTGSYVLGADDAFLSYLPWYHWL